MLHHHHLLASSHDCGTASPESENGAAPDEKSMVPSRCIGIPDLIRMRVRETPNAVAVVFDGTSLTYGELDRRAMALAADLRALRVGPEVLVGVFTNRSIEMIVGLLGILYAGGAYVPLDPAYPEERIKFMLLDSRVRVIVTQRALLEKLGGHCDSHHCVCVDEVASSKLQAPSSKEEIPSSNLESIRGQSSDSLAYVLYTSGSTGRPKGVMVTHGNLLNCLVSMQEEPGLAAEDVLVAVTTISFDIAGLELFLPLITGATVVIATPEETRDAHLLAKLIENASSFVKSTTEDREVRVVMQATPSTWRMLLDSGWSPPPRMRLLCGGEAMARDLAQRLLRHESVELWNMYGPTETTIWSTIFRVRLTTDNTDSTDKRVENGGLDNSDKSLDELNERSSFVIPLRRKHYGGQESTTEDREGWRISIGRPIANTKVLVVDQHGEPQPTGADMPGELLIGGLGVARGYLNREELTREKFVSVNGERFYKTGDLVRFGSNGNLEFISRIDGQVKLRGHRIELGEIESVLREHELIRDCAVTVREDVPGDQRLVGYLVPSPKLQAPSSKEGGEDLPTEHADHADGGTTKNAKSAKNTKEMKEANEALTDCTNRVKAFLESRLPASMIPNVFVWLKALPLTPAGKVDRRGLPKPGEVTKEPRMLSGQRNGNGETVKSPIGNRQLSIAEELEQQIAEVWRKLLGTEQFGLNDNFFDLGGHSILAVKMQGELRNAIQMEVPVVKIFQFPTVRSLARALSETATPHDKVRERAELQKSARAAALRRRNSRDELTAKDLPSAAEIAKIPGLGVGEFAGPAIQASSDMGIA